MSNMYQQRYHRKDIIKVLSLERNYSIHVEPLILHSQTLHKTAFPLTFVTIFSLNLIDLRLILSKISGV